MIPFGHVADLVTVFSVKDSSSVSAELLKQILATYSSDDVFKDSFLRGVVFVSADHLSLDITEAARELLESRGNVCIKTCSDKHSLNPGLYIACRGMLAPVYRLYDDTHACFLHSIRRGTQG
jgi:hypothetical protein